MTERKIIWNAAFEVPEQPNKVLGSGGGLKFQLSISALVAAGKREKEITITTGGRSKTKVGEKAKEQCLTEIITFLNSVRRKPLTGAERKQVKEQFAMLLQEETDRNRVQTTTRNG